MQSQDSGNITDSAAPDIKTVVDEGSPFPPIHRVGVLRPLAWLRLGWRDFTAAPGISLFFGLCFAAMGWLLKLIFSNAPEYLSGLSTGFLLLGPILSLGLYDISRRLERQEGGMREALFAIRGRWNNIGILALVLGVIMLVWARASLVIFALFYNRGMPTMESFMSFLSFGNPEFLLMYGAMGFLFASFVFAISWVSFPLMLDRDTDAISAMIISGVAWGTNMPTTIVWSLLIVGLVVLGFFTWNLGLIVAMPVVGHATWHAYREVVGRSDVPKG
jgi:uncharacterized membrane protein